MSVEPGECRLIHTTDWSYALIVLHPRILYYESSSTIIGRMVVFGLTITLGRSTDVFGWNFEPVFVHHWLRSTESQEILLLSLLLLVLGEPLDRREVLAHVLSGWFPVFQYAFQIFLLFHIK